MPLPIDQAQKSNVSLAINKTISIIDDLIKAEELNAIIKIYQPEIDEVIKARTVGGYESPEPGDISESGKALLAKVYSSCRADGGDKEKCSKIAWSAVNNSGYKKSLNKSEMIKTLQSTVQKIYKAISQPDNTNKSEPLFKNAIAKIMSSVKIDRSFDIPFIAGYNTKGGKVYIDKTVPEKLQVGQQFIEVDQFLVLHEAVEKALIDQLKIDYIAAHQVALRAEKAAIEEAGISWEAYDKAINELKVAIEEKIIDNVPPDLDMTPYEHEAAIYPTDAKVLERMKQVMKAVNDNNVQEFAAQTDYSCGPAAVRIALEMIGITKDEKELRGLLKSTPEGGTDNRNIPALFDFMELSYVVIRNAGIEDLRHYFDMGFKVIVRYYMPQYKADHYTVVQNIDDKAVDFHDPFYGDNTMSLENFNGLWGGKKELGGEPHWMIGVKNKKPVEGI